MLGSLWDEQELDSRHDQVGVFKEVVVITNSSQLRLAFETIVYLRARVGYRQRGRIKSRQSDGCIIGNNYPSPGYILV